MDQILQASGIFSTVQTAANSALRYLPEPVAKGVDFAKSLLTARETTMVEISPEYRELIEKQIETQMEMQQVTFTSNIEKSRHEAKMAAVRNIRVG